MTAFFRTLDRALAAVHRLHPIRETLEETAPAPPRGLRPPGRVTFAFARPVPWPLFLLMDLAAPFAPAAAGLSHRLGRRELAAFALGAGEIEVSLC